MRFLDRPYKKLTKKTGVENLKNFFTYAIMVKTQTRICEVEI